MTPIPYSETYQVRIADMGVGRQATLPAVANWLQEVASAHARELGFSNQRLGQAGVAWVLTRLAVRMDHWPSLGQEVTVQTWPSGLEGLRATRDFRLLGQDGERIGVATSAWVTLDVARRRAVRLPAFVADYYPAHNERVLEFETRTVPAPGEGGQPCTILTRAADLDENGHVNNVRLVEWALEPLEQAFALSRPLSVDIAFRAECLHRDTVTAVCLPEQGDRAMLHGLTRADGTSVAHMRTVWPAA